MRAYRWRCSVMPHQKADLSLLRLESLCLSGSRFLFSLKCHARYKLADMTLYLGKAQLSSVILRGDYLMLLLTRSQAIKNQAWMATYLLSKRNLRKMNGTVGGSYFIFNRWELQIDDNMMYDQKRFWNKTNQEKLKKVWFEDGFGWTQNFAFSIALKNSNGN